MLACKIIYFVTLVTSLGDANVNYIVLYDGLSAEHTIMFNKLVKSHNVGGTGELRSV